MRRRDFVSLICGATLVPRIANAEAADKVWRIGSVFSTTSERGASLAQGLKQSLADRGYVDGRNIVLALRFAGSQPNQIRNSITSLLSEIDLLMVWGTIPGVIAKQLKVSAPTVFVSVGAPVAIGVVQSLAHPGGNMTGISFEAATETYAKRLQLLKEIVPTLKRAAILCAAGDPNVEFAMISLNQIAPSLGISLVPVDMKSAADLDSAFDEIRNSRVGAILVIAGGLTYTIGAEIAHHALEAKLPLCSPFKETAIAGGLVSLGPDYSAMTRQAVAQVDKIIKGENPGDIPVEQPQRYEIYINLKTARSLNVTISSLLLARADQIIE
jgi:putative tryptophan/tyrosine transport system substrate-binding protein